MFSRLVPQFIGLTVLALPVFAGGGWTTDVEASKATAAEQEKDLLLAFTGSDWCPPCKLLRKEVFDQDAFKQWAAGKFVLVELDFPRAPSNADPEGGGPKEALADAYGIDGYPTVVLADSQGRPYASTGYRPGGAEAYVAHLETHRELRAARDRYFAEADQLEGAERAKALLNGLGNLDDALVDRFYPDVVREIQAADPEDQSGFKEGRNYRQAISAYEKQIEALFVIQQYDRAIAAADAFVAEHEPTGEDKQRILMAKVMANVEMGRKEAAFAVIEKMRDAAPESELSAQLDAIKVRLEQLIREQHAVPANEPSPLESSER